MSDSENDEHNTKYETDEDAPPRKKYKRSTEEFNLVHEDALDMKETAGTLYYILLENFMCHERLEIYFNKRITVLSGSMHTGKSAIVTAIDACFNGSDSKSVIKVGRDWARVTVTLRNKGQAAYKTERYGDYITISRKFTYSKANWPLSVNNKYNTKTQLLMALHIDSYTFVERALGLLGLEADFATIGNACEQVSRKIAREEIDLQEKKKVLDDATNMDVLQRKLEKIQLLIVYATGKKLYTDEMQQGALRIHLEAINKNLQEVGCDQKELDELKTNDEYAQEMVQVREELMQTRKRFNGKSYFDIELDYKHRERLLADKKARVERARNQLQLDLAFLATTRKSCQQLVGSFFEKYLAGVNYSGELVFDNDTKETATEIYSGEEKVHIPYALEAFIFSVWKRTEKPIRIMYGPSEFLRSTNTIEMALDMLGTAGQLIVFTQDFVPPVHSSVKVVLLELPIHLHPFSSFKDIEIVTQC